MIPKAIRRLVHLVRAPFQQDPDKFFERVSGVIHVGANVGQESDLYDRHGLRVVWVEPIPDVFNTLVSNIQGRSEQRAVQALVTDRDNAEYEFHVSNNAGLSSSILELGLHKDIWPDVGYATSLKLISTTLPSLLAREDIDLAGYDALVLDTQGSELLVLTGALPVLAGFRFIKTEVPDFEAYAGCCQLKDIAAFARRHGFREISRHTFAKRAQGGDTTTLFTNGSRSRFA